MTAVTVCAFVQARMSSQRFPGKVLAPFRGRPLIWHVFAALREAIPAMPVVVATSGDFSDDPLVRYVEDQGVQTFRGNRDDVFARFRACSTAHPSEWVLRICADSPLLPPDVIRGVVALADDGDCDLVTTRVSGTFPKGHNAELIRVAALMAIDARDLLPDDREHVTPFFYRHPERFRIRSLTSGDSTLGELSFVVDEVEDLHRLERDWAAGAAPIRYPVLRSRATAR